MKKSAKKMSKKLITMKFKKGIFSKVIVAVCIAEMSVVQAWGMWIADKDLYDTAGLVAANHAVFGGELLMLCLKRIFAKDRNVSEEESDNGENE